MKNTWVNPSIEALDVNETETWGVYCSKKTNKVVHGWYYGNYCPKCGCPPTPTPTPTPTPGS